MAKEGTGKAPLSAVAGSGKVWGSRSVDVFEKVEQVGEGTYGQVYKARNKETGEVVALKRVRMDNEKEGFPITAIREIKILKILNHKNVVRLQEIVTSKATDYNQGKGSIYMVMEFLEHDLTGLIDAGQKFTVPQIKCYMKQLLEGLAYCHAQKVLHRDIKGSNLLISNDGHLKLADFGLARPFDTDQQRPYTNRVITLWYRPPELLLGATMYGPAIDMWSAGCIFAELLLRKPILPGKNEFEQIDLIFKLLGTPDELTWPRVSKLQYYDMILSQNGGRKYTSRFDDKFATLDPYGLDLLRKLLTMDPVKRITADDALDHEYFWSDPPPAAPEMLPKYPPSHEFTAKKRRQQQQAGVGQQPPHVAQHQSMSAGTSAGGGGSSNMPLSGHQLHQTHQPASAMPRGNGCGHHHFHSEHHQIAHPAPAYPPHAAQAANPFYATRAHSDGPGPPGAYPPPFGGPPVKRYRPDGTGGQGGGFFEPSQQQGGSGGQIGTGPQTSGGYSNGG